MKKFSWLLAMSISASVAGGVQAQQLLGSPSEIRGKVEQWAPAARVIKVDGRTYSLSKNVQVLNQRAAKLASDAVRPGGAVLLMLVGNEVTNVVVNPGKTPVMDQPKR